MENTELQMLDKKYKLLGYDPLSDYLVSFNLLVLKLEEEQIRYYPQSKRVELLSNDPSTWIKALLKYCDDLGIFIPKNFATDDDISSEGKIYIFNKLLNFAIKEKYQDLCEEKAINDKIIISNKFTHGYESSSVLVKLNRHLSNVYMPVLDENANTNQIRSALRFLLSFKCNKNTSNGNDTNNKQHILPLHPPSTFDNEEYNIDKWTMVLKLLYTFDLRVFQTEMIWLTKIIQGNLA